MKKGKLNLDKRAITKLSEVSLGNIQGGGIGTLCCPSLPPCTRVEVEELEQEEVELGLVPAAYILSCGN